MLLFAQFFAKSREGSRSARGKKSVELRGQVLDGSCSAVESWKYRLQRKKPMKTRASKSIKAERKNAIEN